MRKALLFTLLLCATISVHAQHTLTLTVNSLSDPSKVTLANGSIIINPSDSVHFVDSNFTIQIKANGNKFILKIQQVVGGFTSIPCNITTDSILTIKNCQLIGTNFQFKPAMSFTIEQGDAANTTFKDYKNIKFAGPTGPIGPNTDPQLNPNPIPIVTSYHVGSAYFDARYLESNTNADTILKILDYYAGQNTSTKITKLDSIFKENPFLKAYVDSLANKSIAQNDFSLSSITSSAGGLDVTTIANGIADLMIDRAKQELTVAFFNHFKTFAANNPEFSILFPKTTANLSNLLTYSYPQMLPALRAGFLQDIQQIPDHLGDVLTLPRYAMLLKPYPEIRIAIRSLRLVHELETGASTAADIFNEFAGFPDWNDANASKDLKNAGFCVQVANLLSQSIRNDSAQSHTNTIWVPGKDLKNLFYDQRLFQLYCGLLYQQGKTIVYTKPNGDTTSFAALLGAQQNDLFTFQNKLKGFFDLADEVDATLTSIQEKKKTSTSPTSDDYYNYINTAIDVIDYGFSVVKIFDNITISDSYISLTRKSNDLYKDIYTKAYTQAIQDGLGIFTLLDTIVLKKMDLTTITNSAAVKSISDTNKSAKSLKQGNTTFNSVTPQEIDQVLKLTGVDTTIKQLAQYRLLENLLTTIEKLKPYALFMANIVEAKDENAVESALDNAILPVGSSSIKKNTRCNISVQSYLGAYYAWGNNPSSTIGTWSDKFGVIAPIGISWTPGWSSLGTSGAFSLFGSLFDLGAIVDYKLTKDSTYNTAGNSTVISKSYSVKLGQLFSPGAYVVYGLAGNIPLSIGFGGEYGPGLSKISTTDNTTTVNNPYWRWNVFLAVDLPFFNLVNKNKTTH